MSIFIYMTPDLNISSPARVFFQGFSPTVERIHLKLENSSFCSHCSMLIHSASFPTACQLSLLMDMAQQDYHL